jgi:hypothetical protein
MSTERGNGSAAVEIAQHVAATSKTIDRNTKAQRTKTLSFLRGSADLCRATCPGNVAVTGQTDAPRVPNALFPAHVSIGIIALQRFPENQADRMSLVVWCPCCTPVR